MIDFLNMKINFLNDFQCQKLPLTALCYHCVKNPLLSGIFYFTLPRDNKLHLLLRMQKNAKQRSELSDFCRYGNSFFTFASGIMQIINIK